MSAAPPRAAAVASSRGRAAGSPVAAPSREPFTVWELLPAVLAVLSAVLVYARSVDGGFIWDDPLVLTQLRAMHSWRDVLFPPAVVPRFYFRPLIFASYLLDRSLGGETPFWFHASVIAVHVANVLLVWVLGRRLFPRDWLVPAAGALLFAVFPTHVESVAWMAGRSDVIVCFFVLLTVLLYWGERAWQVWLGGVAFLLALLSKETALACLGLAPALDFFRTRRVTWQRTLPLACATLLYFGLRQHAVGALVGGLPTAAAPLQTAAEMARAVGFYIVQAIVPLRLCAYIPTVPANLGYLLLGVLALLAGAAAVFFAWRRQAWVAAFLVLWFFATLAPALTVIARRSASAPIADRYLYLPSVASCLLLAWFVTILAARWRIPSRGSAAAIIVLAAAYGVVATRYTRVWANDLSFWTDVAGKVDSDALPHRELAAALIRHHRLEQAEPELRQALALGGSTEMRAMSYNELGNLYRRLGRYAQAEQAFEAGIAVGAHPTLYHNLGLALMAHIEEEQRQGEQSAVQRDILRARDAFEEALRLGAAGAASTDFLQWDPAKTHALLGQVLFSLGERAAARQHLETALQLEPTGPTADLTRSYMRRLE